MFHLSLNRNNGEPEKNWLLEKAWRDKEREKGKFHLELHAHTYIHFDFRCMMFNFLEMPSMFICFTDLLIGTMESRNKIDCWRKHGATKEVRKNFIWSYTRTQIHFDFRCIISSFEIQCSCVSLIS